MITTIIQKYCKEIKLLAYVNHLNTKQLIETTQNIINISDKNYLLQIKSLEPGSNNISMHDVQIIQSRRSHP